MHCLQRATRDRIPDPEHAPDASPQPITVPTAFALTSTLSQAHLLQVPVLGVLVNNPRSACQPILLPRAGEVPARLDIGVAVQLADLVRPIQECVSTARCQYSERGQQSRQPVSKSTSERHYGYTAEAAAMQFMQSVCSPVWQADARGRSGERVEQSTHLMSEIDSSLSVSPRKPRCTTVRFAGRPS